MTLEISRSYRFEAAHYLPNAPEGHKCRRLHGHSFGVVVTVGGEVTEPEGWICDFSAIDNAWLPLHDLLDHRLLNEVPGLENPTSERLAKWIWDRLADELPGLAAIDVAETCTSLCRYRSR